MELNLYILTTSGISEIIKLEAQDERLRSVICEKGHYTPLPISPDYHFFVSAPTGIIQQYFGAHSFRVEVSQSINQGHSWQLGLFVAHGLFDTENQQKVSKRIKHLFLSGTLSAALEVGPVSGIEEKMKHLNVWIQMHNIDPSDCLVVLPKGNQMVETIPGEIEILSISRISDLEARLGLSITKKTGKRKKTREIKTLIFQWPSLVLFTLFICLLLVYATAGPTWNRLSQMEQLGKFRELITELRKMRSGRDFIKLNTAAIFEENQYTQALKITAQTPLQFTNSQDRPDCFNADRTLNIQDDFDAIQQCQGELHLINTADNPVVVWISYHGLMQPDIALIPPGKRFSLEPTSHLNPLTIVVSQRPITDIYDWLSSLHENPSNVITTELFRRAGISLRSFNQI